MSALSNLRSVRLAITDGRRELEDAIRAGLAHPSQKLLPSQLLYDDLGSALFEVIGLLPEYGLTRADERILKTHSGEILRRVGAPLRIAELGSGGGRKTRWILEAAASRPAVAYHPIDVSAAALERCAHSLSDLGGVRVEPIESDYIPGLRHAVAHRRARERMLVLFLGSTIGNFDRAPAANFLREIRILLEPGDGLLLGTDLVKPVPDLLAAYDDALGVTAAFDLNLLVHVNREFGADFDPRRFAHQARWNEAERRIEMHLVARAAHAVSIPALGVEVELRSGESLWTESSHKFEPEEALRLAERAGFRRSGQWLDSEWAFAESLFIAS